MAGPWRSAREDPNHGHPSHVERAPYHRATGSGLRRKGPVPRSFLPVHGQRGLLQVCGDASAAVAAQHCWTLPEHRRSEEHTSELQSQSNLVCRLLLEKKKNKNATLMWNRIHYDPFKHITHTDNSSLCPTLQPPRTIQINRPHHICIKPTTSYDTLLPP